MLDYLYQAATALAAKGGFAGSRRLGDIAGWIMWHALLSRRSMAAASASRHLGCSEEEGRRIARASFAHTGRAFCEAAITNLVDWRFEQERLHIASPANLASLQATKGPMVLACAHLGSWELLAGILQLAIPGRAKGVVVREGHDEALNYLMQRQRGRPGVEIIGHRNAAPKVLRLLRNNGVCAFLVDHNTRQKEAVFLPFLGEEAAVNAGPAMLAVRSGATVWPVFMLRQAEGQYELRIETPLYTSELDLPVAQKIEQTARFYTMAVEQQVRRNPEQWLWMHKRWKTRKSVPEYPLNNV